MIITTHIYIYIYINKSNISKPPILTENHKSTTEQKKEVRIIQANPPHRATTPAFTPVEQEVEKAEGGRGGKGGTRGIFLLHRHAFLFVFFFLN
jgi:hypothetical protein